MAIDTEDRDGFGKGSDRNRFKVKRGSVGKSGAVYVSKSKRREFKARLLQEDDPDYANRFERFWRRRDELVTEHPEWDDWEPGVVAMREFPPLAPDDVPAPVYEEIAADVAEDDARQEGDILSEAPSVPAYVAPSYETGTPNPESFADEKVSLLDVLYWVGENVGMPDVKHTEAPNKLAWNMLNWVRSKPDAFWSEVMRIAKRGEGQDESQFAKDDGVALELAESELSRFAEESPELVGKEHADFTKKMYEEAGGIASGGGDGNG